MDRPRYSPASRRDSRALAQKAIKTLPVSGAITDLERRTLLARLTTGFQRGDLSAMPAHIRMFSQGVLDSLRARRGPK